MLSRRCGNDFCWGGEVSTYDGSRGLARGRPGVRRYGAHSPSETPPAASEMSQPRQMSTPRPRRTRRRAPEASLRAQAAQTPTGPESAGARLRRTPTPTHRRPSHATHHLQQKHTTKSPPRCTVVPCQSVCPRAQLQLQLHHTAHSERGGGGANRDPGANTNAVARSQQGGADV